MDTLIQAQRSDQVLHPLRVSLVGGVGTAHSPADHQEVSGHPSFHQQSQRLHQFLSSLAFVQKAKIAQQEIVWPHSPARPLGIAVVSQRGGRWDVASDGNQAQTVGWYLCLQLKVVLLVGDDGTVGAAGQQAHHLPAQRPSLGEEIGNFEVVERHHHRRAILAARHEIDGWMHPVGRGLVLDVQHV